jgi:Tetratricopeptide repeat
MSSANLLAKPRSSSPTEAPVSCAAWYNLSDLLDEQGRSEAAIDCLRKALGAAPATLLATDGEAASNRWCAVTPKRSENCGYATLDQCRAYMLGLGGCPSTSQASIPSLGARSHRDTAAIAIVNSGLG